LNNLASLLTTIGAYEKAAPLYREAVQIRTSVLSDAPPDYASSLGNLANLFTAVWAYVKAVPLRQEAMQI